ncbi:acetyl-CoA carboxylase biotin carboxyl carrier protein [Deinococcus antarcticus]|uniref:Biotin carboxyl carrier protein of acetyl-CoA carboxylase n=1 Tax=Deinococcus antarcticus TaxID=1298767 RepID=A0ABV8A6S7_9DEIO
MNPTDLKTILDALTAADVREFSLTTGSYALDLKRGPQQFAAAPMGMPAAPAYPMPMPAYAPAAPSAPAPAATAPAAAKPAEAPRAEAPKVDAKPAEASKAASKGQPVKAPIVGTFYSASSPDAPAYVKVGDRVKSGQVLCIIEAMKLMNEIEAEMDGTIVEILVKNAEPVEYGQTLFMIE